MATTTERLLFLTGRQWRTAIVVSVAVGLLAFAASHEISFWIGAVVFATVLTGFHMAYASQFIVPFPHLAILIASLQYVLAAWFSFYYPPANPVFDSSPMLSQYLWFGAPVVLAVCTGWTLTLLRLPLSRPSMPLSDETGSLIELDLLVFGGLAALLLARFVAIPGLSFLAVLIANLRYVGVYGRMILRAGGWGWRLAIVLGAEILLAADAAMFHPLLLWTVWSFAMWMYCYRPRPRAILIACAVGALLLPALQEAKWRLRGNLAENDEGVIAESFEDATPLTRASDWARFMTEGLIHTIDFGFTYDFLQDTAARYNQGWIVSRVMAFVPELQPYAQGSTIKDAVKNAVIPRLFEAEKATAGGRENMLLYAGLEMSEGTSMNLGFAGEMYANFGLWGGVLGCAGYAMFFGILFRFFCRRAFVRPMWWAVVPYVFFYGLKAEDGIYEVLNWTTKSCVVVFVVYLLLPHLRRALSRTEAPPSNARVVALPTSC